MKENELTHLIDYEILKEWGFEWGTYMIFNKQKIVTVYFIQDTSHTNKFLFQPVVLQWCSGKKWTILMLIEEKEKIQNVFFEGEITGKINLRTILKSVLVFKPKKV